MYSTNCAPCPPCTVGDVTPCAEEQLPVPGHYSVTCRKIEDGLKCELKCHPMFKFNSSEDVFPQYCHDGVWDFQRYRIEIPDCQREHTHVSVFSMHIGPDYIMQLHVYILLAEKPTFTRILCYDAPSTAFW